jgi:hypothetical protein
MQNKTLFKIKLHFLIRKSQKKMKKATINEWKALQLAIQKKDIEQILICGSKWNSALSKYRQQHLNPSV